MNIPTSSTSLRRPLVGALIGLAAIAAAGALVLAARGTAATPVPPAAPLPEVDVATIAATTITQWQSYSGHLEAVDKVEIRPQVAGAITAVHFKDGALVNKGDPLFTIDPRPYQAEVDRAAAQLAAAQARSDNAAADAARAERLIVDNAMARREYESKQNGAREAAAGLNIAQAGLEAARINLSYTRIAAPIGGRVSRAEFTVGNIVAIGAGAPVLTTLVSASPIYASFEVDEQTYLRYLSQRNGRSVPVLLGLSSEPGLSRKGSVASIDNQLDRSAGTIRVRASFPNADGALVPGLFARIELGGDIARPAVLVQDAVIITDQDKKFVYVVDASNRIQYREVTPGELSGGLRIISRGLADGERIAVKNLQRIHPGDTVRVKPVKLAEAGERP